MKKDVSLSIVILVIFSLITILPQFLNVDQGLVGKIFGWATLALLLPANLDYNKHPWVRWIPSLWFLMLVIIGVYYLITTK